MDDYAIKLQALEQAQKAIAWQPNQTPTTLLEIAKTIYDFLREPAQSQLDCSRQSGT